MAIIKNQPIGKRYGSLVVVRRAPNKKGEGHARWLCSCDCGTEKVILGSNLTRGLSKSCGCGAGYRLPKGQSMLNYLYSRTEAGACRRKYAFDLTREEFAELISKPCVYCGAKPRYVKQRTYRSGLKITGIDRIDNSKGYTVENCVSCCPT